MTIYTELPTQVAGGPHLAETPARLGAPRREGSDVTVAILDTLIDETHPALAGRCVPARVFDPGWPAHDRSGSSAPACGAHGTATASIVAAEALAARIAPLAVLSTGPTCARVLLALDWLAAQPTLPPVICMALGLPGPACVLDPLLARLAARGSLLLAAVGNYGAGVALAPAVSPHVLAVGTASEDSTGRPDGIRAYSGSTLGCAFRPAPSPDVAVTIGGLRAARPGGGEATASGTSAAVARLAGLCALLASLHPDRPAAALASALAETALPPRAGDSHRVRYGTVDFEAAAKTFAQRHIPLQPQAQQIDAAPRAPWPQIDRFLRLRLTAASAEEPVEAALRFADFEMLAQALENLPLAAERDAIRLQQAPILLVRLPAVQVVTLLEARGLIAAQSAWPNLALLHLDRIGR